MVNTVTSLWLMKVRPGCRIGNPWTEPDGFGSSNSLLDLTCGGQNGGANNCGDVDTFLWDDAVMYFALVDRFHGGDGQVDDVEGVDGTGNLNGPNGNYVGGDLEGMTSKLPYLADLGVSALWLSAPFENRDAAGDAIDPLRTAIFILRIMVVGRLRVISITRI